MGRAQLPLHVCIYLCKYVRIYVCLYVRMYVCMYWMGGWVFIHRYNHIHVKLPQVQHKQIKHTHTSTQAHTQH